MAKKKRGTNGSGPRSRNIPGNKTPARLNYSNPSRQARSSIGSPSVGDIQQGAAMVDPWCEAARGSKIPDDDSTPSVPLQFKCIVGLDSDANGRAGVVVKPSPTVGMTYGAATLNGSQILTWGSAYADPSAATIAAAAGLYRIVSFGVRVYSTLAPTDQSGILRFITVGENVSTSSAFTTSGGFFERVEDHPVANADVHWVSRPVGTRWKEYTPIADQAWYELLVIFAKGLPASTTGLLQLEIIFNLELQATPNNLASAVATAALVSKPHILQAASLVHAGRRPHHNGSTTSFNGRMRALITQGLHFAARAAFPYASAFLGNRMARLGGGFAAPQIMDVD